MAQSSDTPMMRQYRALKSQQPDRLLLFRMGDFYELFFADAERAASLLDLTLTKRGEVPMAGVPAHSLDTYLARLLKLGESAVICDQVGSAPEKPGTLMDRQITRIVTPGTLSEEELLPANNDNLVAAVHHKGDRWGLAWMDISNGRLMVTEPRDAEELVAELSRRPTTELLLADNLPEEVAASLAQWADSGVPLTPAIRPHWEFDEAEGRQRLLEQLGTSDLTSWDCADLDTGLGALGALLCYAAETLRSNLPFSRLTRERQRDLLFLDPATRNSLEIDHSLSGDQAATLLAVLDSTCTPMGARLLRHRLQTPTRRLDVLGQRHDAIETLAQHDRLEDTRQLMRNLGDLSRALTRINLGTAPPRDLIRLRTTLATLPDLSTLLGDCRQPLLQLPTLDADLGELHQQLAAALVDAPPATIRDGGIFASGYDQQLDELRTLNSESSQLLAELESSERQRTGIQKLRAGYNRVHGYYLEIPRSHTGPLPEEYSARQTLKNTQRYTTPTLQRHEEAVLSSQARALEREKWLYRKLLEDIAVSLPRLQQIADALAELDFLASQAERAINLRLRRPQFSDQPGIQICGGRHPVVEMLQQSVFTANDLEFNLQRRLLLITGPNMGGKSTYMRQTALIVLMAHAGCMVAAEHAVLGPIDRILTRIGASDRLGRGQSTFMVEMTEVAYLLRNASTESLVLLDEVGRGTGTRDGQALSYACLLWFGQEHPCYTLFATHFVELTQKAEQMLLADNIHFDAEQKSGSTSIRFLHRAQDGPTNRSYGLAVARLAGVPEGFFQIASDEFDRLERQVELDGQQVRQGTLFNLPLEPPKKAAGRYSMDDDLPADWDELRESEGKGKGKSEGKSEGDKSAALELLRALDPNSLSPREALAKLYELHELDREQSDNPAAGKAN